MPKKEDARPGEKLHKIGDMTVGIVARNLIRFRRDNYRRMSALQKETLKASIDKFGFQSFVVVRREEDGMFGVVDGHHRLEELDARGATEVPVLVLPDVSSTDADLGMLSFNVSAEVVDDALVKLLTDLQKAGVDNREIAKHATVSDRFMEQMSAAINSEKLPAPEFDDPPMEGEGGGKNKKKKVPDVKVIVLTSAAVEVDGEPSGGELVAVYTMPTKSIVSQNYRNALTEIGLCLEELEAPFMENEEALSESVSELLEQEDEEE